MLDSHPPQPVDSMIGNLLVASTTVQDPVLARAVCLVVHQDSENVFAVLLNRPMNPPPGLAKLLDGSAHPTSPNPAIEPPGKKNNSVEIPGTPAQKNVGDAGGAVSRRSLGKKSFHDPTIGYRTHFPGGTPQQPVTQQQMPEQQMPEQPETDPEQSSPSPPASSLPPSPSEPKQLQAQQIAAEAAKALGTIHFGGPLSGPVVAVHNSSEHAEAQAGKGVYVAAQRDLLETLVKQRPDSMRLIVGHLGWSVQQLQAERDSGYWHMIEATDDDVFTGDQDLWPSVIRRATTASMTNWIGVSNTPFASEVN